MMQHSVHKIIGVSGDEGSFSEEAAILYSKQSLNVATTIKYLIDMEGVLSSIENKEIDIGIFPVVNLYGGLVKMAFEAMGKHRFKVVDELWLEINQCLLTKPGTSRKQIKKIISHPQAIVQCKQYLQHNFGAVQLIESQDTAKSAKELSQNQLDSTCAVIAPNRAAEIYGLEVLAKNIQDVNPNLTAFIIVNSEAI